MQSIVYKCAAYDVVKARKIDADGTKHLHNKDVIAIGFESVRYGVLYHMFTLGSVASYALAYNECPTAAVKRAKKLGHKLYWANPNSVSITAEERPREEYIKVVFGDIIYFEGHRFRVKSAPNYNVELEMIV